VDYTDNQRMDEGWRFAEDSLKARRRLGLDF
jgi:hypothetical protein